MRIKYEVSAGGLVLRRNGASLDALLIGRGMPRVWSLPKGHLEARETHEMAALREVREAPGRRRITCLFSAGILCGRSQR